MQTHKSKIVYSVDQIGYGTHHQRRTFEQNADFVNPIQFILSVDATRFIQYRVYNKTADLKMVHLITAADLYYRKKYYAKYSWKYERG